MKLIPSKQTDVRFAVCNSPVTIDKRAAWGNSPENLQVYTGKSFIKLNADATEASHLVGPNDDGTAPTGWVQGSSPGLFSKNPIWVGELVPAGQKVRLPNIDSATGFLEYKYEVDAVVCANDDGGSPSQADQWAQKIKDLRKNYEVEGLFSEAETA